MKNNGNNEKVAVIRDLLSTRSQIRKKIEGKRRRITRDNTEVNCAQLKYTITLRNSGVLNTTSVEFSSARESFILR